MNLTERSEGEITRSEVDLDAGFPSPPSSLTTKIYYFIDEQPMPYSTEIPVPPKYITLSDFKANINGRNYKYFSKVYDTTLKEEVKTDILNEDEPLKPNKEGRYELFLCSINNNLPSTLPLRAIQNQMSTRNKNFRHDIRYDDSSSQEDTTMFGDSNTRMLSEEESACSTTFTSVSEQERRYGGGGGYQPKVWKRGRRKRPIRKSYSFLSSTFDDTDMSMNLDLVTVTFQMSRGAKLGLIVKMFKKNNITEIRVFDIERDSLAALDGRIRKGSVILEVNGIPLEQHGDDDPLIILTKVIKHAISNEKPLTFVCATTPDIPQTLNFRLREEPVRPIDMVTWIKQCEEVRKVPNNNYPTFSNRPQSLHPTTYFPMGPPQVPPHHPLYFQSSSTTQSQQQTLERAKKAILPPAPGSSQHAAVGSTTTSAPGWPSSGVGSSIASSSSIALPPTTNFERKRFPNNQDRMTLLNAMAHPTTGIELIQEKDCLQQMPTDKIFSGSKLLNWLLQNVEDLNDVHACENFATRLLGEGCIEPIPQRVYTKETFYTFSENYMNALRERNTNTIKRGAITVITNLNMSSDELTTTNEQSFNSINNPQPIRCRGGLACKVRRMFCIQPKHRHYAAHQKGRKRRKTPKPRKNAQPTSTRIP